MKFGDEDNEAEDKSGNLEQKMKNTEDDEENTAEIIQESPSGQKRHISHVSNNKSKKKRKSSNIVSVTTASAAFQNMNSKLNNSLTTAVQLEDDYEGDEAVYNLKTDLEELNKQKEILIKYFQQQTEKAAKEDVAET